PPRLGRSQGPAYEGGPDGPGPEQLRLRTPLHGASTDVEADLGKGLSGCLAPLLFAGARRDDHAAWRGKWNKPHQAIRYAHDLLRCPDHRGRAWPSVRFPPPQGADAAPLRDAHRQPADL